MPLLTQHFLEKYGEENQQDALELTPEALDLLMEYDWPGNVRELENVIERAVVLSTGTGSTPISCRITSAAASASRCRSSSCRRRGFRTRTRRLPSSAADRVGARAAGGVQKRAAELLHIKPTTLNEMIKRHDIRPRRKRGAAASRADAGPEGGDGATRRRVNDEGEEVGVE